MEIKILRLTDSAIMPRKAHANDQCWDLFSDEYHQIIPGKTVAIATGIKMILPDGYGLELRERSGLALNHRMIIGGGIIDNGYVGEVKIIVHNMGNEVFNIVPGDRLAQAELVQTINANIAEVSAEEFNKLSNTARGEKGFGSSGK